uniref:Uncharacterized protein n=1 Tax=Leersia perrieri TaxID=77586 RepID=A0A0D9W9N7_9ORYZ
MELIAAIIKILSLISEACRNAEKLPAALITGGVVEAVAAIFLAFFKPPGGLFEHHGKAAFYLYYAILVGVAVFGFVQRRGLESGFPATSTAGVPSARRSCFVFFR